jgi:hypothetical protein
MSRVKIMPFNCHVFCATFPCMSRIVYAVNCPGDNCPRLIR